MVGSCVGYKHVHLRLQWPLGLVCFINVWGNGGTDRNGVNEICRQKAEAFVLWRHLEMFELVLFPGGR